MFHQIKSGLFVFVFLKIPSHLVTMKITTKTWKTQVIETAVFSVVLLQLRRRLATGPDALACPRVKNST